MDANAVCAQLRDSADSLERGEKRVATWFASELRDAADLLQAESHAGAIAQSHNERLRQENADLRATERVLRAALVAESAQSENLSLEVERLRAAILTNEERVGDA